MTFCRCTPDCTLKLEQGMPVVDVHYHQSAKAGVVVAVQHLANANQRFFAVDEGKPETSEEA